MFSTSNNSAGGWNHSLRGPPHYGPRLIEPDESALNPGIQEKLAVLTRVAKLLGIDDVSFSNYAAAITRLSTRTKDTQQRLNRLELVERQLQDHLVAMGHEERLLESGIGRLTTELATGDSVPTLERRREVLLRKAKEYRAMLDGMVIDSPAVTFTDTTAVQASNAQRSQAIKEKRAQIKAFKGLPPNLDLARQQLQTARAAQMELVQLCEKLLAQMAAGVA
ncbi:hypothetical protein FB45DRAFT_941247 [Roridomyces roridus]|uniref:Uncharacterized protein n=1 Tax=Roridomyces roridus TaxID=1738132 RepID=A0AAD7FCQ7_9AGAR|nr:hypothetical protein FB45DRAFT_941247 [Roridomyces roridus]